MVKQFVGMKAKELIEKLRELPEDATISMWNDCEDAGLALCSDLGTHYMIRSGFGALKGKTISNIEGLEVGSECVIIDTIDGYRFKMYHFQECCECVRIEDVNGSPYDLIGEEVNVAGERIGETNMSDYGTQTWTFYTLRTVKGSVDIRWLGESNGCYSEAVQIDIELLKSL